MPTVKVAVGYLIEQDVMDELSSDLDENESEESEVSDSEGAEIITLNPVLCKVIRWKARLTPEQQARTPEILYCLRDTNVDSYASFVPTRWEYVSTSEEVYEKLLQYESDKAARQRFMEVFGRGIHESHMKFATRPYRS